MTVNFAHRWKTYQGMRALTVLAFHWGMGTAALTVLNFTIELEF